ncbi:MAG: nuclear transport factor 2 family protein [Cyclobacteriaceae bacterium]
MSSEEKLVDTFYQAFKRKDWQAMQGCYHPDISFSDPAFPDLKGKAAKAMWHMLVEASTDLNVSHHNLFAESSEIVKCQWEAIYSFSRTGRKVHNVINALFSFQENLIITHRDSFDLWKWSRMALGAPGLLLGWTPFMKRKIQNMANNSLTRFIEKHPAYQ